MDVRQLEMFRAVAEEGSFTRAAERLHVSQSAVSRQVQLLEDELGGRLLHRGKRALPTPPGELLLRLAQRVQRDMQEVVGQISDTQELRRGTLTLAGGMTVCMQILPPLLKKYRRQFPGVELRVVSVSSETTLRLLRSHDVDLALLTLPVSGPDLEVVPVLREDMVAVMAPGHPLARQRTVEPQTLARFPLILYERGSNSRRLQDGVFAEVGTGLKVAMETENVEIIKAMVAAGLGITLIPYAAIARDVRARRFAFARLRGRSPHRETGWVYLRGDSQPRAVTEMLKTFESMKDGFGGRLPAS
jgi:DNA-binding transcriptional LysR family regulator